MRARLICLLFGHRWVEGWRSHDIAQYECERCGRWAYDWGGEWHVLRR